jgi:hypothetical protein
MFLLACELGRLLIHVRCQDALRFGHPMIEQNVENRGHRSRLIQARIPARLSILLHQFWQPLDATDASSVPNHAGADRLESDGHLDDGDGGEPEPERAEADRLGTEAGSK